MITMEGEFRKMKDELEEHRLRAENYKKVDSQLNNYGAKLSRYNLFSLCLS